jgi:uncharacterized membrane protein
LKLGEERRGSHLHDMMYLNWRIEMTRNIYHVLFILITIAVVVSVDLLFFKKLFWERLMANIGIVLVFAAFYLRVVSLLRAVSISKG